MGEVGFNDVFNHLQHKSSVLPMPFRKDFGDTDKVFAMHLNSNISGIICCIVASLVYITVRAPINLLLCDMTIDLSYSDTIGTFGPGSLLKMVP